MGAVVRPLTDDSDDPITGRIVGQIDEDRYLVAWGSDQFAADPTLHARVAYLDDLAPIRSASS